MQDLVGTTWGRFQIIEERGRGGMAVVYKAYDDVLQRTVALKVLLPVMAANQEFTQRFRREAITAANLRHPNIVVIYDVGEYGHFQYIVMEYLEGPTLQQVMVREGVLPPNRVVGILNQLADALDYAHRQGLIHRDIKPANIMLDDQDHVTLTDFGLVKAARGSHITGEGVAIGTLQYMSPEQARGTEIDHRSDIYSLGIVVYEMLTGRVPFTGTTPYQTLHGLIYDPPPLLTHLNPNISPAVEQVVLRALAKEPQQRFASAGEFAQAVAAAAGLGPAVPAPPRTDRVQWETVLRLIGAGGREFPVYRGETTIGRDTGNDIVIPVKQISRRHARLHCDDQGCVLVDEHSTNGTFVNGARIPPETPWPLHPGDVLRLGPVQLLVALPAQPDEATAWQVTDTDTSLMIG